MNHGRRQHACASAHLTAPDGTGVDAVVVAAGIHNIDDEDNASVEVLTFKAGDFSESR